MVTDVRVGVDVGGTNVQMLATWGDRDRRWIRSTGSSFGQDDLDHLLEQFVQTLPCQPSTLGIAVPGLVHDQTVFACDVLPLLEGWDAARWRSTSHVVIANDVAAACAQEFASEEKGLTAAIVMAGTGVGAAFLVDGRPFAGGGGWAGELGSVPIAIGSGEVTIDALGSGAAICRRLGVDGDTVARRAHEGDIETLRCIRESGEVLGLGLAVVVNLFNPDRLSLAGGALQLEGYADAALATARRHALPPLWDVCRVRMIGPDEIIVARGALRLAASSVDRQPT